MLAAGVAGGWPAYVYLNPRPAASGPVNLAILVMERGTEKAIANARVILHRVSGGVEESTDSLGTARFEIARAERSLRVSVHAAGYRDGSLEIPALTEHSRYRVSLDPVKPPVAGATEPGRQPDQRGTRVDGGAGAVPREDDRGARPSTPVEVKAAPQSAGAAPRVGFKPCDGAPSLYGAEAIARPAPGDRSVYVTIKLTSKSSRPVVVFGGREFYGTLLDDSQVNAYKASTTNAPRPPATSRSAEQLAELYSRRPEGGRRLDTRDDTVFLEYRQAITPYQAWKRPGSFTFKVDIWALTLVEDRGDYQGRSDSLSCEGAPAT